MRSRTLILLLLLHLLAPASAQQRFSFTRPKMGSPFTLVFYAPDSATALRWSEAAFMEADRLNSIFSDWDSTSELSRFNRTAGSAGGMSLSVELWTLLQHSRKAAVSSRHKGQALFDPGLSPLIRLWREGRSAGHLPPAPAVEAARRIPGVLSLKLWVSGKKDLRAALPQPGMAVDLGGIAKGYIAGKVAEQLRLLGATAALVAASGDIWCSGAPPGSTHWRVGYDTPAGPGTLLLKDRGVSTSGDRYQYLELNGLRYSHILDPRTGTGDTARRQATVAARTAHGSDWLATACTLLPWKKARRLCRRNRAALLHTEWIGGRPVTRASRRFRRLSAD